MKQIKIFLATVLSFCMVLTAFPKEVFASPTVTANKSEVTAEFGGVSEDVELTTTDIPDGNDYKLTLEKISSSYGFDIPENAVADSSNHNENVSIQNNKVMVKLSAANLKVPDLYKVKIVVSKGGNPLCKSSDINFSVEAKKNLKMEFEGETSATFSKKADSSKVFKIKKDGFDGDDPIYLFRENGGSISDLGLSDSVNKEAEGDFYKFTLDFKKDKCKANAGNYSIFASCKGAAPVPITIKIVDTTQTVLKDSDFQIDDSKLTYNGELKRIPITTTLKENEDYTVSGTDTLTDVAKDDVTVTFTGKGKYTGSVSKKWNLKKIPYNLSIATVRKDYDGTKYVEIEKGGVLGVLAADANKVFAEGVIKGEFDNEFVGKNKAVNNVTNTITLAGEKAGNYILKLLYPTTLTGEIKAVKDPAKIIKDGIVQKGQSIDLSSNVKGAVGKVTYEIAGGDLTNSEIAANSSKLKAGNTPGFCPVNVTISETDKNSDGKPEYTQVKEEIKVQVVDKEIVGLSFKGDVPTVKRYGDKDFTLAVKPAKTGKNQKIKWTVDKADVLELKEIAPSSGTDTFKCNCKIKSVGTVQISGVYHSDEYTGNINTIIEIKKGVVKIKANDKKIKIGDYIPNLWELDYTITGLAKGDYLGNNVELFYEGKPDNTKIGTYPIRVKRVDNLPQDKYNPIVFEDGTLTIEKDNSGSGSGSSSGGGSGSGSVGGGTGSGNSNTGTSNNDKKEDKKTDNKENNKQSEEKASNKPISAKLVVNAKLEKGKTAVVKLSEKTIKSAIDKAKKNAEKQGSTKDKVALTLNISTSKKANSLNAKLDKKALNSLINENVLKLKIKTPYMNTNFDLNSLKSIKKQGLDDVDINIASVKNLSSSAKNRIGDRPVYEVNISDKNNNVKISKLDKGVIKMGIPYTPKKGENPDKLYAVYLDKNGKPRPVKGSYYDEKSKMMMLSVKTLGVYGVASK